jgi:hypothetical protein
MFNPGMFKLILFTGLIVSIFQVLIARIYFKSINLSLLIIAGSIIVSFLISVIIYQDPKIFNFIFYGVWKILWQPLGAGALSGGNFAILVLLPLTMVLIQAIGSILGGLLGLKIWMTFFRF